MRRWFALLLSLCLVLGAMSVTALEQAAQILPGETVSIQSTQQEHIQYYHFKPDTSGIYVFYDLAEGLEPSTLTVADAAAPDTLLAQGTGRVSFTAQAGVTYRFGVECEWVEGGTVDYSFRLTPPTQVERLSIQKATLEQGFAGDVGTLALAYTPFSSGAEISWSSTDPQVVTVTGDQNGAEYTLVGEGKADIVASTADGKTAKLSVTVKSMDVLTQELPVEHTIPANGGRYATTEHSFRFTPEVGGSYALSVQFDESLPVYHDLQMSILTGEGYVYSGDVLRFDAIAGNTYQLDVEFWGIYDEAVTYQFVVQPCVPGESISLISAKDVEYVGSSLLVQVEWNPKNSLLKELTWSSSNPNVAQITAPTWEYATVELLAPGEVVITASTEDGLLAQLPLTVYAAPALVELVESVSNPVTLLGGGYTDISFTPSATGYYRLTSDNASLGASLFADSSDKDGEVLYYMEAGQTYYGGVDNYSDGIASGNLYIAQAQVLLPVGMEITKLPGNTVYLKDTLKDMWTYQLLAGLEMDVSWSDGAVTQWRFDEEGPYIGHEYLDWKVTAAADGKTAQLQLFCNGATAQCTLTLLNKTVTGVTLLDASVLKIVENSCGIDMGNGTWYYYPYLSGMRWVRIHFSDGSISTLRPDQQLYGYYVTCTDSQMDTPWVKGGQASVTYGYMDYTVELEVQIIDSPVERIELVHPPVDTFVIGDPDFFSGVDAYYFAPDRLRDFIDGLSFQIWYKDGTTKTVAFEQIQWEKVMGEEYPCVDGYPLGLFGELLTANELIEAPCEKEGIIEYMGAAVTYPIYLVEGLPQPPDTPADPTDPSDPTDPTDPSGTEDPSGLTDPAGGTDPTDPAGTAKPDDQTGPEDPAAPTDPADSTAPSQTQPTQQTQAPTNPAQTSDPVQSEGLPGWAIALIVIGAVVFAGGGVAGWLWWKKHM